MASKNRAAVSRHRDRHIIGKAIGDVTTLHDFVPALSRGLIRLASGTMVVVPSYLIAEFTNLPPLVVPPFKLEV